MSSKPKTKTYIVHHRGQVIHGGYTVLGRYKIGARNEKEAKQFLREKVGKHTKVKVYYEDKNSVVSHGSVVKES
ncbi:hypothetical protein SKN87_26240 (plasmid) [Paenibacillus polymyxa]|uniref:Uncharacterized protein n=1 Tax=Paenibacillus polymyxa (strain SC2) TaxID=886882 RepID=E3EJX3_PAEPS|nr:hypothetical protein [Paenibacillus polymyxa]ADO59992.1 hypothetical protein PPSC2_28225 [Paenibacillus polymyxa SC2]WPQ59791.1 hypothetical protein SKN87_26240 [Paenibacillus polymyxa]